MTLTELTQRHLYLSGKIRVLKTTLHHNKDEARAERLRDAANAAFQERNKIEAQIEEIIGAVDFDEIQFEIEQI